MSAATSIQWTDRTWNPVRGCSVVSPGCVNCYAMKQAHRFSGVGKPYQGLTKQTSAGPQWTGAVRGVIPALNAPLRWKKPARIFVNSMSDLFHEAVSDEWIDQVFAVMALCPQHTFQILTKRADRMRAYMVALDRAIRIPTETFPRWKSEAESILQKRGDINSVVTHQWPLPNVWLGVSVENQKYADERVPMLLQAPAAVRFISAEPLLGPVELTYNRMCGAMGWGPPAPPRRDKPATEDPSQLRWVLGAKAISWVIVGGESGNCARMLDTTFARSIVKQCAAAGVACFVKQLGAKPEEPSPGAWNTAHRQPMVLRDRKGGDMAEWPADLRVRQFPAVPA